VICLEPVRPRLPKCNKLSLLSSLLGRRLLFYFRTASHHSVNLHQKSIEDLVSFDGVSFEARLSLSTISSFVPIFVIFIMTAIIIICLIIMLVVVDRHFCYANHDLPERLSSGLKRQRRRTLFHLVEHVLTLYSRKRRNADYRVLSTPFSISLSLSPRLEFPLC
jgi:hypothetical protein